MYEIKVMSIKWPESRPGFLPKLQEIKKGGDKIWRGTSTSLPTVISAWEKSASIRQLDPGEEKEYKLKFENNADLFEDESQYNVEMTLENSQTGTLATIPVQ